MPRVIVADSFAFKPPAETGQVYFEDSVRTAREVAPQPAGAYNNGMGKDHWSFEAQEPSTLIEPDGSEPWIWF